ncbi:nuclear transport factor 2 family protein [Streptomyces sp. NBC_00344]|uniref:nuclear transport factor 2 family protein n=1 Tax=Streptomyces sp. NBC_00344 TaxID=2975720 RepID=UPI002E1E3BDC
MAGDRPLGEKELADFVQEWFDRMSRHDPVGEMLPFVADSDLEMAFPERTLRSHDDFRDWYAVVGEAFADQTHVVEKAVGRAEGDGVAVDVTVVWTAKSVADGTVSSFRVQQKWRLAYPSDTGRPVIVSYLVGDLTPIV